MIETRGEGGYIAVAPTPGYHFIQRHLHQIPRITIEERNYLLSAAIGFNQEEITYPEGEGCFEAYNRDGDILGLLQKHGWQIKQDKGNHVLLKRPGSTDSKWSADYTRDKNWFTVFSTSTEFESLKAYRPAAVYCLLECKNDWKEASRKLRELNFGQKTTKFNQQKKEPISQDVMNSLLESLVIDTEKEIEKPPIILSIKEYSGATLVCKRIFSLGNFSCIIGKAKTKKTFLISLFTANLLTDYSENFVNELPDGKKLILYFDTEQGAYDSYRCIRRIQRMANTKKNLLAYNLRSLSPRERCQVIEYAFIQYGKETGLCVIDGIADLSVGINDEEEASRVCTMLLKLTKDYNCHILTVIHQNKNDNYATGHLGSSVMKKAEIVISVEKIREDSSSAEVRCDMGRGIDFENFIITINESGIPVINNDLDKKTNYYETKNETTDVPF